MTAIQGARRDGCISTDASIAILRRRRRWTRPSRSTGQPNASKRSAIRRTAPRQSNAITDVMQTTDTQMSESNRSSTGSFRECAHSWKWNYRDCSKEYCAPDGRRAMLFWRVCSFCRMYDEVPRPLVIHSATARQILLAQGFPVPPILSAPSPSQPSRLPQFQSEFPAGVRGRELRTVYTTLAKH